MPLEARMIYSQNQNLNPRERRKMARFYCAEEMRQVAQNVEMRASHTVEKLRDDIMNAALKGEYGIETYIWTWGLCNDHEAKRYIVQELRKAGYEVIPGKDLTQPTKILWRKNNE